MKYVKMYDLRLIKIVRLFWMNSSFHVISLFVGVFLNFILGDFIVYFI